MPANVPKAPLLDGRFVAASFTNQCGTRATYVPAMNEGRPRALVVMLHGCGQGPDDFALGTRMNQVADELGFIVAYPELYAAMGIHSGIAYAAASDLQSALAVMSGQRSPPEPEGTVAAAPVVPTIVFHGDFDTTVHPRNAEQVLARSLPRSNAEHARPIAPPTVESGVERGRMYTRATHADSCGNPAVEHWIVHGGGHAWFGGDAKGSFADASGPDATRAMLRFFHRCA